MASITIRGKQVTASLNRSRHASGCRAVWWCLGKNVDSWGGRLRASSKEDRPVGTVACQSDGGADQCNGSSEHVCWQTGCSAEISPSGKLRPRSCEQMRFLQGQRCRVGVPLPLALRGLEFSKHQAGARSGLVLVQSARPPFGVWWRNHAPRFGHLPPKRHMVRVRLPRGEPKDATSGGDQGAGRYRHVAALASGDQVEGYAWAKAKAAGWLCRSRFHSSHRQDACRVSCVPGKTYTFRLRM